MTYANFAKYDKIDYIRRKPSNMLERIGCSIDKREHEGFKRARKLAQADLAARAFKVYQQSVMDGSRSPKIQRPSTQITTVSNPQLAKLKAKLGPLTLSDI